uniref:Uncharacterized protein n=1 Tax=Fagus sylvatica TaxID=28930 RepID=A0A2N9I0Y0_FAGSY
MNFFVGVCRVVESEGKAICFRDLVPIDYVLRRLSEELFALAFPAISTWKLLKDRMASEGSSQLAPNAWRTTISCMVLWKVCSKGADSLTVDEFLYCYKPCQIAVSLGFWTLNNCQKGMKLEGLPWEEKDDSFVKVRRAWGTPPTSTLKHPKLNQERLNRVLQALHHRDHHYTNFIQPEVLALYSFGLEPNETVLSLQITNQQRMATAKLNKDKLKRMMEQKDAVLVNLGKKRRGDSASKLMSNEVVIRPAVIPKSTVVVQVPATSVEVIELTEIPSSSKVVDKAPTLALDPSLALQHAKSAITKEDMDEYGKLNMDVVKQALAHSLMKGLTEAMVVANRCMHWEEGIVKLKSQLTNAMDANKTLSSTTAELTPGARVVEEYKSSDACDDNNTKYFLAGFELLRKQAKEKYPDLDFDVFQPYEDDDSVASVEERNDAVVSVDPQLTNDATT